MNKQEKSKMPTGVYNRTIKHRIICSKAGIASRDSIVRQTKDQEKHCFFECIGCGDIVETTFSNVRLYCSRKCKDNISIKKLKYGAIHGRVKRLYGEPSECENCFTTKSKKFEWANVTGNYGSLARKHWKRLCCQCHRRFDLGVKQKIDICI